MWNVKIVSERHILCRTSLELQQRGIYCVGFQLNNLREANILWDIIIIASVRHILCGISVE